MRLAFAKSSRGALLLNPRGSFLAGAAAFSRRKGLGEPWMRGNRASGGARTDAARAIHLHKKLILEQHNKLNTKHPDKLIIAQHQKLI